MREFAYRRTSRIDEALHLVARHEGARFLAGGTNLVDLMKAGVESPARLVDIRSLTLDEIGETPDGGLVLGATATNSAVAADPRVRGRYPALSQAILLGASGQLRNMATVGGTCCSAPAAPTSPTRRSRATGGFPAADAPRSTGRTTTTRSSGGRGTAWPPTPRTWPCR
ncbi:FAD binding domain-containing protein [Thermocatellispora tengchongensis]|uniref:FAD binding domain-containing protein n=1 Tax=Thermocatellispora tengchongensis TaxID=1073253 RepID=UPI00363CF220